MSTGTLAESSPVLMRVVVDAADAVLVRVTTGAVALACAAMVMARGAACATTVPRAQLIVEPVSVHDEGEIESTTMSAGTTSASTTAAASAGPLLATVIEYVSGAPAMTCGALTDFVTTRSAFDAIGVVDVDEFASVAPVGSGVVEETTAVFESVPVAPAARLPAIVTVAEPPAASVGNRHVTVVVPLHVPAEGDADVSVTEPGIASEIETADALEGPLFVTVSVHVTGPPAPTDPAVGVSVFVIPRSALAFTVTGALAVAGVGSGVALDADALFVRTVPLATPDATWATTLRFVDAPGARSASAHDTFPAVATHAAGPDTNVRPAGSTSFTTGLVALDGPLFVIVIA
jgi:hypothetical protein